MDSMVTSDQIDSLLDSISTLSNLEHLVLSENSKICSIPESIGNLRKLHTLDLSGCYDLKTLPDSMDQMVSLKVLNLERVTLDELVVSRFNCASSPHFEVHASGDKCSSNIILLRPTNPVELWVDRLENVKSAEEAHDINLIEKQKIEELTLTWTVAVGRFVDAKEVLEKLVPPSSVLKLYVVGYRSVSLPDWLMVLGQLPNLVNLNLYRMEGLEEWNMQHYSGKEGSNELMFPKLERLTIEQCSKLRIKPCLPRAMSLHISGCDTMLSSWEESSSHSGISSTSPLTELNVTESKVAMHEWRLLHHLPALRDLTITGCSDLTTSPQIIHSLSSLKSLCLKSLSQAELPRWLVELTYLQALELNCCRSMTYLPEWLGELISLKNLVIIDCRGIQAMPDSVEQLTKLEHLTVLGCPTLGRWCESKENKTKLAHIRNTVFPADLDLVPLHSAVMNTPGFTKGALRVAVSNLEKTSHSSVYMSMNEEHRVLWLRNFLAEHYYNLTTGGWWYCD
ncbi:uncharacterized protein [Aegilops tauschii subsp. strangulata]|uniref:Putative disease resistance protein RGA3 n=1 Tax=Aegilops tauschii TaxID=37682 RepID=R7W0K7_AEGTA|nr:putative disease resistance protein RGA3 [Triticum aestivum]